MQPRRALLLGVGVITLLAPRRLLAVQARVNTIGYDGTDQLEPRPWLVTLTRLAGILAVAAALATDADPEPQDTYV